MSSDDAVPMDGIAEAAEQVAAQPASSGAPALAANAPPAKKYPDFHPEEWRRHPMARMVNGAGDFAGKLVAPIQSGTAKGCNLGESYAFCVSYYMGKASDVPPWVHPLLATGAFGFALATAHFANRARAVRPQPGQDDGSALAARLAQLHGANSTNPDESEVEP